MSDIRYAVIPLAEDHGMEELGLQDAQGLFVYRRQAERFGEMMWNSSFRIEEIRSYPIESRDDFEYKLVKVHKGTDIIEESYDIKKDWYDWSRGVA